MFGVRCRYFFGLSTMVLPFYLVSNSSGSTVMLCFKTASILIRYRKIRFRSYRREDALASVNLIVAGDPVTVNLRFA